MYPVTCKNNPLGHHMSERRPDSAAFAWLSDERRIQIHEIIEGRVPQWSDELKEIQFDAWQHTLSKNQSYLN